MIELDPRQSRTSAGIGVQPISVAAIAFALVLGIGSIALWRAYTGNVPEPDRVASARLLQVRAAQASEQLAEKTKGIEATQQESIDQLQVVQDQLQTVRRLLASQQADTKKLAEQVNSLTGAIDGLRQSFASAQAAETTSSPSPRTKSIRARTHGLRNSSGKRGKPQG
jgi:uncharacterized protein HemX